MENLNVIDHYAASIANIWTSETEDKFLRNLLFTPLQGPQHSTS